MGRIKGARLAAYHAKQYDNFAIFFNEDRREVYTVEITPTTDITTIKDIMLLKDSRRKVTREDINILLEEII